MGLQLPSCLQFPQLRNHGSNSDNKTFLQGTSEKISFGCVDNKNKPVTHININEMTVLLNNPEVGKRKRVKNLDTGSATGKV